MSTRKTYLLDTHALIWYQGAHPSLSPQLVEEIRRVENRILFSQVSLLEIAIKQTIGKLPDFTASIETIHRQAIEDGFEFLPLGNHHISAYQRVPLFTEHRDPFDRLLIGIAASEGATILTADTNFSLYQGFIETIW